MAHRQSPTRIVAHTSDTVTPRLLAVNGQDPDIYRRFEAIGRPLPVREVRVSAGLDRPWVDQPTDHLPSAAELAALVAGGDPDPERSDQDDLQVEERLEREAFEPDLGGDNVELWGGEDW